MDVSNLRRYISSDDVEFFKACPEVKEVLRFRHLKSGDTAAHFASRFGSIKVLEYLIDNLKADMEVSNNDGKRPLHEAAQFSREDCVRVLLKHHVQIDPLKRADWTPLMLACTKQSVNTVDLLLEAGADPCLTNKDGWNSFHIACREGHLSIIQTLVKYCPSVWNTSSNNFRTPLHTAALHGHKDAVSWLLHACRYKVDTKDSCGTTPLMDALRSGHIEVAEILLEHHKAEVTLEDKAGWQSVHLAAQTGQTDAIEFLVKKIGVSVNSKSSRSGETPLHIAAKEGQTKTVEVLLRLSSDVDVQDKKGLTALHWASMRQHADCVTLLLKHKARLLLDMTGSLPQQFAHRKDVIDAFRNVK